MDNVPEGYAAYEVSEAAKVTWVNGGIALLDFTDGRERAVAVQLELARLNTEEPVPSPQLIFTMDGLAEIINHLVGYGITTFGPMFPLLLISKIP